MHIVTQTDGARLKSANTTSERHITTNDNFLVISSICLSPESFVIRRRKKKRNNTIIKMVFPKAAQDIPQYRTTGYAKLRIAVHFV